MKRRKRRITRKIKPKDPASGSGSRTFKTVNQRMAEETAEKADQFRQWFEKRFENNLPYSMDSVRKIDYLLYKNVKADLVSDENLKLLIAFFSEVLRRNFGGAYEVDPKKRQQIINFDGLKSWPEEKITRTMKKLEREGIPADAFAFKTHGPLEKYMFNVGRKVSALRSRKKE